MLLVVGPVLATAAYCIREALVVVVIDRRQIVVEA